MKKGFTLIELLAVIVILGFLVAMVIDNYKKYLDSSKENAYLTIERNMEAAAESMIVDCSLSVSDEYRGGLCVSLDIPDVKDEKINVSLNNLVTSEYIDDVLDPANTNKKCDYENSYVTITNTTRLTNKNISYSYKSCLKCGSHTSDYCN
ncbi:MAG: type II secretion system protein [Bacilli bacterium]|nr:type II secretion system protein [Bacilli bacterium]